MYCPNCGYEQKCSCNACVSERECRKETFEEKPWVWTDEYFVKCGNCGLTASEDWWNNLEMEIYLLRNNRKRS